MRILIIEDEKKLAISLKKSLETESYAADVALDGENGLNMALDEKYDVIILDLGLPIVDGLSVAKKIRKEKIKTPILMLTARDAIKNKIEGLDSGADDYLVKPFDFQELLARIRALLRRGDTESEITYEIDSLRLNPASHIVKRGSKEIALTAKEYGLLEFLMRSANKIVTRTQIIEHVWDIDTDPFSNVIDVYVGYLRNKIDKAFPNEKRLIHTIKGLGYKIGE